MSARIWICWSLFWSVNLCYHIFVLVTVILNVLFVYTASSNRSNKDSENQPIKGGTIMDMDEEASDKVPFINRVFFFTLTI